MAETPTPSEREQRLERIIADYLHALEAGQAPCQAELPKQYPELTDDLGSFFRNHAAMERIAEPIKGQLPALVERSPSGWQVMGGAKGSVASTAIIIGVASWF